MGGVSTAGFAREIDRLVIGVHRAVMQRHGASLRPLIGALGLESPGHLYDLVEFFAVGACSDEVARLRFPYDRVAMVTTMFHELHQQQLIDPDLNPSAKLVGVIDSVLEARAETAASLWGAKVGVAQRGADEALTQARGKLVDAFRTLPETVPAAWRLHHVLTGLRYARLDAHVAAWQEARLDAAEIAALSAAVGAEPAQSVPRQLIDRGWLTDQGAATPEGRTARESIETQTNERSSAMFGAVGDQTTWHGALCSLRTDLDQVRPHR